MKAIHFYKNVSLPEQCPSRFLIAYYLGQSPEGLAIMILIVHSLAFRGLGTPPTNTVFLGSSGSDAFNT